MHVSFSTLLNEAGVAHEFLEKQVSHCGGEWDAETLEFMTGHLAIE